MDSLKRLKQLQNKMEPNYWLAGLWHVYRKLVAPLNLVAVISNNYVFHCVAKWSVQHQCNLLCWLHNTTDNSVPPFGKIGKLCPRTLSGQKHSATSWGNPRDTKPSPNTKQMCYKFNREVWHIKRTYWLIILAYRSTEWPKVWKNIDLGCRTVKNRR